MLYDLVVLICLTAQPSFCQPVSAYRVMLPSGRMESAVSCQIMQGSIQNALHPPIPTGTFIKVLCRIEGERGV